jgi:outer membrane receptor protein involved in Fe transport
MAADDDAWSAGLAFGGSLTGDDSALYRLSAHHHTSNGYRDNPYLGREDTNGREETALRGRLSLASANDFSANLAFMYTSIDNGYDAFSLDNSYTMLSDKPGKDAQESIGGSLRLEWFTPGFATLTSITTLADSSIDFSFDADWGNDESWAPVTYDYTSVSDRNRQTISQEFRLASGDSDASDWLIGFYSLNLREDLQTVDIGEYYDPGYDFADSLDSRIASDYEATNVAMFGQVEHELTAKTRLGFGLRAERRMTNYDDNQGLTASPSESMWGGDISLSHDLSEALTSYLSLSKGYKAGGFNLGRVPDGQREFGKEELWNLEAGMKAELADSSVFLNASLFANRRDNQQVRISEQLDPGDPTTFVFFTDNVDSGESIGFEADLRWLPNDNWQLYANVGLLSTDIAGGRDQAHAPAYTAAVGGQYRHDNGWYGRVDMTARDAFYFDVSHDQSSEAYELVNLRIGYDANTWSVQLWARNLFDQQYAVRGFYFGNEPPDFPATLYTRQGDPRQVGLTLERRF